MVPAAATPASPGADRGAAAAGLARLTINEKECLRRRLLPETAKEMALALGISPHAVEKRLKMARTKLGVSSSLVAARLLAEAERYQLPVPQPADLPGAADAAPSPARRARRSPWGVFLMIAATACLFVLLAQDVAPPPGTGTVTTPDGHPVETRKVGWDEAAAYLHGNFVGFDVDRSGFLDPQEASVLEPRDRDRDPSLPAAPPPGTRDVAGERKWMAKLDTDRDGRVSEQEYTSYMIPWILWQGVPVWQAKP